MAQCPGGLEYYMEDRVWRLQGLEKNIPRDQVVSELGAMVNIICSM